MSLSSLGRVPSGSSVVMSLSLIRQLSDLRLDASWRHGGSLEEWICEHDEFRLVIEYVPVPDILSLCFCNRRIWRRFWANEVWEMMCRRDLSIVRVHCEPDRPFPNPFFDHPNNVYRFSLANCFEFHEILDGEVPVVVDENSFVPMSDTVTFKLTFDVPSEEELAELRRRIGSSEDARCRLSRLERTGVLDDYRHGTAQNIYYTMLDFFSNPYQALLLSIDMPKTLRGVLRCDEAFRARLFGALDARRGGSNTFGKDGVVVSGNRLRGLPVPVRQDSTMKEYTAILFTMILQKKDAALNAAARSLLVFGASIGGSVLWEKYPAGACFLTPNVLIAPMFESVPPLRLGPNTLHFSIGRLPASVAAIGLYALQWRWRSSERLRKTAVPLHFSALFDVLENFLQRELVFQPALVFATRFTACKALRLQNRPPPWWTAVGVALLYRLSAFEAYTYSEEGNWKSRIAHTVGSVFAGQAFGTCGVFIFHLAATDYASFKLLSWCRSLRTRLANLRRRTRRDASDEEWHDPPDDVGDDS